MKSCEIVVTSPASATLYWTKILRVQFNCRWLISVLQAVTQVPWKNESQQAKWQRHPMTSRSRRASNHINSLGRCCELVCSFLPFCSFALWSLVAHVGSIERRQVPDLVAGESCLRSGGKGWRRIEGWNRKRFDFCSLGLADFLRKLSPLSFKPILSSFFNCSYFHNKVSHIIIIITSTSWCNWLNWTRLLAALVDCSLRSLLIWGVCKFL